ncbi:MAG: hypothetical protein PVI99_02310 [Anaerolineales bacterium]|jgi:hypothetical protein
MTENVESSAAGLQPQGDTPTTDRQRGQPTSPEGLDPEDSHFEKVLSAMIEKEVAWRFQSAKDKRWAALEKKYGGLSELSEQARDLISRLARESGSPAPDGEARFENRIHSLAGLPGIRENEDAQALILRSQGAEDLEEYAGLVEGLLRLALGGEGGETASPPATPATAVIPGGSDSPGDLEQAYRRRRNRLRPGDVNALTALKREFRQKGLDVF